MCMLCIEVQKGKMTAREAIRAYREFKAPEGHDETLWEEIRARYGEPELSRESQALIWDEVHRRVGHGL